MHNQPLHPIFHDSDSDRESLIDPPSESRFVILSVPFFAALMVILGRMVWVHGGLQERYLATLNATSTEYEAIPARDGRILTESATVLAADVDQYAVRVHYRWLQHPVDDAWLSREVRRRLTRSEWNEETLVRAAEQDLLREHEQMWTTLAETLDLPVSELLRRRQTIQSRVERIAESVNRRNLQTSVTDDAATNGDGPLVRLATSVRAALTTVPRRKLTERIVVREEESFHEIVARIPLDIAARIREQPHRYPGVQVVVGQRRTYPQGSVAAHLVGARTSAQNTDAAALKQAADSETRSPRTGLFGVERSYNHQLRSVPGRRRIVRNRRMEIVEIEVERQPVSGRDVVLTLDFELQKLAEHLLAESLLDAPQRLLPPAADNTETPQPVPTGGSIVVLDVTSGRLLIAASAPGFDLSLYTGGTVADWKAINSDQRHPFVSRATKMMLPPGSVMKPFTAAAALESGGLDPGARFHCQGYLQNPEEHRCLTFRLYGSGHGDITLSRAIAQSCNVYFFSAAQQMGFQNLREWCDRFGFGRATGIDLPAEQTGHVPGSSALPRSQNVHMEREVLGLAIGQSSLTVTPLQIARAMAAIANGGWLVTPHVVSSDGTARTTGDIDDRPRSLTRRRIPGLSDATLNSIRAGLKDAVQQPFGTGYKTVRTDELAIAGKTGTAETGPGRPDHAWFAGYLPADEPRFAVVVVLEHGGSGSRAAGPLAREVIRAMLRDGHLPVSD